MKNYAYLLSGLFLLAILACTDNSNALHFQLDTSLTMKVGETASWDDNKNIQIRLDSVPDDSRCPKDVQCIWAGRAEVAITFTQDGNSQKNSIILGDPTGTDYSDKAVFGDFTVTLVEVNPQPVASEKTAQEQYVIELKITKGG